MAADDAGFHQLITVRRSSSYKLPRLYQFLLGIFHAHAGLFAFPLILPEPDIVQQFINMLFCLKLSVLDRPD